ncbi:Nramp family divalent metal transporter [Mesorhizobium sp. ANAO-SY3R2]|uniref:Nramp family divalent metal transporter n=1 Tax=Mesorhizobium sp. ANAO-SY3R2 TaxID=3166644 RepID=UPI003670D983
MSKKALAGKMANRSHSGDPPTRPGLLRILGPGLITGASDDDPSGIATYSQTGAQFGYVPTWTLLFSYPLMVAIQIISARLGRTTGRGIAGNLRKFYPNTIVYVCVSLLLVANIINLGADIGAMADAVRILIGGPQIVYVLLFGTICVLMQVFLSYKRYVGALKWLTFALFAYIATLFFVKIDWSALAQSFLVPHLSLDKDYLTAIVAILGTTISPYLFFWQSSQEVEDIKAVPERKALKTAPKQAEDAEARIRLDTFVGMGFSNIVALAIMVTAAATLHANGITDIESSAQAAQALKPVAGIMAETIFALGVVGTGLLAVPVLAGSAAYAVGETLRWPTGLNRKPKHAKAFYATIAIATLIGVGLNFTPINPIRALYWSAVINGVVAVPIMAMMMLMSTQPRIMGKETIGRLLGTFGWLSTGVMALTAAAMILTGFL